ncbi:MAG: hypothetical protein AAFO07_11910 [Bacteroidota bacterium]
MSSKDLFDQFRDVGSQMSETPSPRTWKRLERRLDRRQRRTQTQQSTSTIAVVLLLLVLLMSVVVLTSKKPTVDVERMVGPVAFEVLEVNENSDQIISPITVKEYQRAISDKARQPIEEGESGKRLKPAE